MTNAVESLNMLLRRIIKTRGAFPSEDADMKLLYLAVSNVTRNGRQCSTGGTILSPARLAD